jgi:hypothetical protein
LVLPPFVLCIGVGKLEVFSCFNLNF